MEKINLPNKLATRLKQLYKLQIHCPLPIESFLHLTMFLLEAISLLSNLFTFATESRIGCIKLWMEDLDFQRGRQLRSKWRRSRGRCAKDRWWWPKWRWWRGKRKVRMVEDIEWLSRGRTGHRGYNLARSKARARSRDYNRNAVRRKLRLSIVRSFAFQTSIPWWGDVDRWFSELLWCGTLVTSLMFCQLLLLLLTFLKAFLWDDGWGWKLTSRNAGRHLRHLLYLYDLTCDFATCLQCFQQSELTNEETQHTNQMLCDLHDCTLYPMKQ